MSEKELILGLPRELKVQCLRDALNQNNIGMFFSLSNVFLEAPIQKGGIETKTIQMIHEEYLLSK